MYIIIQVTTTRHEVLIVAVFDPLVNRKERNVDCAHFDHKQLADTLPFN